MTELKDLITQEELNKIFEEVLEEYPLVIHIHEETKLDETISKVRTFGPRTTLTIKEPYGH